jgi:hypothetical protein
MIMVVDIQYGGSIVNGTHEECCNMFSISLLIHLKEQLQSAQQYYDRFYLKFMFMVLCTLPWNVGGSRTKAYLCVF